MEIGNIVEYIDHQKIICAVVMEIRNQRLRLINEANREVNLSSSRLSHKSKVRLDLSIGRDKLVEALHSIVSRRKALITNIDIKELWDVLNSEQQWIDLETMTEFCFPNAPTSDHESAVVRAFFSNKIYFKFNVDQFFPNTESQVEEIINQAKEAELRTRIIEQGGDWLKKVLKDKSTVIPSNKLEIIDILKSIYIFQNESPHFYIGKALLSRAGFSSLDEILDIMTKLGVWNENENLDIYRLNIPVSFPEIVTRYANNLALSPPSLSSDLKRKDLTSLPLLTIDGQATLDFDDALSIEDKGDHYLLGIHIADVSYFVKNNDLIDKEALNRGSSIYMPDQKIPMLPPCLAEDFCSLKEGKIRPAISVLIKLNKFFEIMSSEITPSIIQVKRQLTYFDVNLIADIDKEIVFLQNIAKKFRQKRIELGAVQITLPEINIWINDSGEIILNKVNRESPGRMLVSELMIMANWIMAKFLSDNKVSAVYRTQIEPKDRLYKGTEGNLFQNWMQRKLLHRFILNSEPNYHSGLGLNVYVTATSPIRKYFDLLTQRQLRSILNCEKPYKFDEIEKFLQNLEDPMKKVASAQFERHKYWKLKYLENQTGQRTEAIVLSKRKNFYTILLTDYMIECTLPFQGGSRDLKPEDLIQITIQRVNARKDVLNVFLS